MATPDTELFAISTIKVTWKNLNKLQKQEIFNIENSEVDWIHPIGKTISVCCYCKCLSGHHKKLDLFTLSCIPIIHDFKVP